MPQVMDADRMSRALTRIAHEILERNRGTNDLALVGIRTRGVPLARRIAHALKDINREEVPTGSLDITLYRDDLMRHAVGPQPVVRRTEIPFSIDDRRILLVDDVLYTGRTIRSALDALIDFGRPRSIQRCIQCAVPLCTRSWIHGPEPRAARFRQAACPVTIACPPGRGRITGASPY